MCTFLGTAGKINENDVSSDAIKKSEILKSVDSEKYRGGEIFWDLKNKLATGMVEVFNAINR